MDTPRLAVATAGQPWAGAISQLDAAEALAVSAGTVQQLIDLRALAKHLDGGLQLADVPARLVWLSG